MTLLSHLQASTALTTQREGELRHISELQAAEIDMYFSTLWSVCDELSHKPEWLQLLRANPNSSDYQIKLQSAIE